MATLLDSLSRWAIPAAIAISSVQYSMYNGKGSWNDLELCLILNAIPLPINVLLLMLFAYSTAITSNYQLVEGGHRAIIFDRIAGVKPEPGT